MTNPATGDTTGTDSPTLTGKWALITGAARRVGAEIATTLHAQGAGVAIHYRGSADQALTLVRQLNDRRPDSALAVQADLVQTSQLGALIETVTARSGRLDILINNASSFYPTPLATVTESQWADLIGTILMASLFLAQAALPHLKASRGFIIH